MCSTNLSLLGAGIELAPALIFGFANVLHFRVQGVRQEIVQFVPEKPVFYYMRNCV